MADQAQALTDRQARCVISAAEARGFEREPHRLWWQYDDALHEDAAVALDFMLARDPDAMPDVLSAPDPLPGWVAAERITDERGGLNSKKIEPLIDAAVARGLMGRDPEVDGPFHWAAWDAAVRAVGVLWEADPAALREVLGDRVTLALLPATAMSPCPSICDNGWVQHKFAGDIPAERPKHW